jgi:mannosyltransferase OCH1-like enzyme
MPADATREVIQGLWIGAELSALERLSINSFLRHGHPYHLYVYQEPAGVPAGAVIRDAAEILPSSRIFQYRDRPSYAGFANFFRYKLLLERGGWWADADVVCLRPFDFPSPYVFASEPHHEARMISSAVIKAPEASPLLDHAWRTCQARDPRQLTWGETGPRLMDDAVRRYSLEASAADVRTFCPLPAPAWKSVLDPAAEWRPSDASSAIHLWNEMWRRNGQDKNLSYPPGCLYEQLKSRYRVDSGGRGEGAGQPAPG